MQKALFLFIWLVPLNYIYSQSNTVSTGSTATAIGTGTVSYSIGQIDYSNQSGADGNINQGVQQPFEFYILEIQEFDTNIDLLVYPNPTIGIIRIESNLPLKSLKYSIATLNGTLVLDGIINENGNINLSELPASFYLVSISSNDTPIQTFKIFKQ